MWDERYSSERYAYGEEPNDFLVQQSAALTQLQQPARVLCLADGEGRNGVYLATLGHDVTAVDLSSVGLAKAQALAKKNGVTITTVHADLAHYRPAAEQFDAVVMIFAHTPPDVRQLTFQRVRDTLVAGGVLILEGYTPDQIPRGTGGPKTPDMMFTLAELQQQFGDFHWLCACEVVREIHEGEFHTGAGAVVQFVAVKPS